MVVYSGTRPLKSAYRRFRIQSLEGHPDDYASMQEEMCIRDSLHGDIEKRRLFLPGGQGEFCRDRIIGNRQGFKPVSYTHLLLSGTAARELEAFQPEIRRGRRLRQRRAVRRAL